MSFEVRKYVQVLSQVIRYETRVNCRWIEFKTMGGRCELLLFTWKEMTLSEYHVATPLLRLWAGSIFIAHQDRCTMNLAWTMFPNQSMALRKREPPLLNSSNVDLLLLSQSNANVLERIRNMKQQFVPITICIRAWIRENPNYFI